MERHRPNDSTRPAAEPEAPLDQAVAHTDDDDAGILSALLWIALELRHPLHHLGDEHARRTFFDTGFAALCRCGHPVRRTGGDHLALYQLLDWPRRQGRSIAEQVLRALERRPALYPAGSVDGVDTSLVRGLTRARLVLVRTTSCAGAQFGFEDLATGRTLRSLVPKTCSVAVGDTVITRFAPTMRGHLVPIADLLVVPRDAEREFEARILDPDGPRGPDARSTQAARLFRAWTLVAFGDGTGVIDPSAHLEEEESTRRRRG
jgi:hypothetical protein